MTHEVIYYIINLVYRNTKEQSDNELVYGTQLNGDSQRAPPWPEPQDQNEIMFILPRKLNSGDRINITGTLRTNPKSMSVHLITGHTSPDYQNIACQFEALFPNDANNTDQIIIKVVQNGVQEIVNGDYQDTAATDLFTDANFTFGITLRLVNSNYGDIPIIDIYVGGSYVQQIQLKHNLESVRFLMLNGDIEKVNSLDFQFS